jgi:hypothetical protein
MTLKPRAHLGAQIGAWTVRSSFAFASRMCVRRDRFPQMGCTNAAGVSAGEVAGSVFQNPDA